MATRHRRTDRQMDGQQTPCRGNTALCVASLGNKTKHVWSLFLKAASTDAVRMPRAENRAHRKPGDRGIVYV